MKKRVGKRINNRICLGMVSCGLGAPILGYFGRQYRENANMTGVISERLCRENHVSHVLQELWINRLPRLQTGYERGGIVTSFTRVFTLCSNFSTDSIRQSTVLFVLVDKFEDLYGTIWEHSEVEHSCELAFNIVEIYLLLYDYYIFILYKI